MSKGQRKTELLRHGLLYFFLGRRRGERRGSRDGCFFWAIDRGRTTITQKQSRHSNAREGETVVLGSRARRSTFSQSRQTESKELWASNSSLGASRLVYKGTSSQTRHLFHAKRAVQPTSWHCCGGFEATKAQRDTLLTADQARARCTAMHGSHTQPGRA